MKKMDYPYEYGKLRVASYFLANTLKSALESNEISFYKPVLETHMKTVLELIENESEE